MFYQIRKTLCLQSVDAVRIKVVFCGEYARECTTVHDRSNAAAGHEIERNEPPTVIFLHNNQYNILFCGLLFTAIL